MSPKADVCEDFAADMKHREEFVRNIQGMSEEELKCMIAMRWSDRDEK